MTALLLFVGLSAVAVVRARQAAPSPPPIPDRATPVRPTPNTRQGAFL